MRVYFNDVDLKLIAFAIGIICVVSFFDFKEKSKPPQLLNRQELTNLILYENINSPTGFSYVVLEENKEKIAQFFDGIVPPQIVDKAIGSCSQKLQFCDIQGLPLDDIVSFLKERNKLINFENRVGVLIQETYDLVDTPVYKLEIKQGAKGPLLYLFKRVGGVSEK